MLLNDTCLDTLIEEVKIPASIKKGAHVGAYLNITKFFKDLKLAKISPFTLNCRNNEHVGFK